MIQMFIVHVMTSTQGHQVQLMFNNETRAKACYRDLRASERGEHDFEIEVMDDYGQTMTVNRDETPIIVLQDLARLHEGQAEIQMMHARAGAALQRKQQQDPALRIMTAAGAPPGMRLG